MPTWLYEISPLRSALIMVLFIETVSLVGLFLARRFLLPHLTFSEGINDAVSGSVQAIGVFYGITVGLIAVGVWDTNSIASDIVSREAASIAALYRDAGGYPSPLRDELRSSLRDYTLFVVQQEWPAQRKGQILDGGTEILDEFQSKLYGFEPSSQSLTILHSQTVQAFHTLTENRRMRIIAVGSRLSRVMWAVIWIGAAISISVTYLFKIDDLRLHSILIVLMGGLLAMVLFMITINDRPFYGLVSVPSEPFELVIQKMSR